jgi:hypothetical protein
MYRRWSNKTWPNNLRETPAKVKCCACGWKAGDHMLDQVTDIYAPATYNECPAKNNAREADEGGDAPMKWQYPPLHPEAQINILVAYKEISSWHRSLGSKGVLDQLWAMAAGLT